MRIGIYGGTYNPPHLGHFRAAEYARQALKLHKLFMVPTNISPHKQLPEGSPDPMGRLQLVALGARAFEGLEACDIELRREGPSYTWQTLEALKAQYPSDQLFLLMGTDMFLNFLSWREPQKILSLAELAVFYRGEQGEQEAIDRQRLLLEQQGARVHLVKNPVTQISSTELRRMLLLDCASAYLPASVEQHLRKMGWYGTGQNLQDLPLDRLEAVALGLLKPSRIPHVLGCRDTAVALAKRWGEDVQLAARAALLHDVTKALPWEAQLTLLRSYGMIPEDFSDENAQTVHALTGSLVAQRIFGEGAAVVSAIAAHTTGKPGMSRLDAILWLADYIEPNRDFPGVEEPRRLAFEDLKTALMWGLNKTITHLQQKARPVAPKTAQTLLWLQSEERKIL